MTIPVTEPGLPDERYAPPAWLDRSAYPFAHRFATVRDGRMHYVDEGSGDPVVFSHGTPTWSFEYRHVIRTLREHARCIAPDHLGFGLSDRPRNAVYSPEAHARRFAEFVDALGLDRLALVVHDFGGPIALPLALDGRVTKLVILNTWMWPFDDDKAMASRARMVRGGFGRFMYRYANMSLKLLMPSAYADKRRLTKVIHRHYLKPFENADDRVLVLWALAYSLLGSSAFYGSLLARAESLHGIPVHIIWGMRDTAFQPDQLHRWQSLLPDAIVTKLPDAGHWPHEEAPSEVAELIADFLAPR